MSVTFFPPMRSLRLLSGVCQDRHAVRAIVSNIGWRSLSMKFAFCVTIMRRAKVTIGMFGTRKSPTALATPTRSFRTFGVTLQNGEHEMKTVTLQVANLDDVKRRVRDAFKGKKQGSRISFAKPELLFRLLTAKRWELIRTLTGAGPVTIREAARRVKRDVKAVHGDVHTLLNAGILQKTVENLIVFPFDAIRVDVMLRAA
jgi:predicted transcriptional regulator